MISREEKIQMLGALGDDKLDQALQALGISCGGSYADDMGSEEPEEGLIPWNATDVKVPATVRPPIVDSSKIYEQTQKRPYEEPPAMGPDMAPWAATAG